jgi:hypothetical protein
MSDNPFEGREFVNSDGVEQAPPGNGVMEPSNLDGENQAAADNAPNVEGDASDPRTPNAPREASLDANNIAGRTVSEVDPASPNSGDSAVEASGGSLTREQLREWEASFSVGQSVRVRQGTHRGLTGEIQSIRRQTPEDVFQVRVSTGVDAYNEIYLVAREMEPAE